MERHLKGSTAKTAAELARYTWPKDEQTVQVIKATQTPGLTGGWGGTVAVTAYGEFLASLAPYSAIAQIASRGLVTTLEGIGLKKFPRRTSAQVPMSWTAEGEPIKVTEYTFGEVTLTPKKMSVLTIFSRELAKRSDAENVFGLLFREDSGLSIDAAYLSSTAASSAAHPGLLSGLSATATGIGDGSAVKGDLSAPAAAVSAGGSGEVVFITSPVLAAKLPIIQPEITATVLASAAVPSDRLIAIDPRALIHGFAPVPDISASTDAVVHMSDSPLELVDDSAVKGDPLRSMYQTNSIALRNIIDIAFGTRRSGSVAFMDGVIW